MKDSIFKALSQRLSILSCIVVATTLTGCGVLDEAISNAQVSNADNNKVITIGDSIFALSGALQDNLEESAGESFRRYTLSGAQLTGGWVSGESIPEQYEVAKWHDANIETVIMDAGGNDILIPAIMLDPQNCKTQWYQFGRLSRKCKNFIDDLYVDGVNFLNDMSADGVENVIWLGYYHTKNGLLRLDDVEEAVDYGAVRLGQACNNATLNCTFVDPRSVINDRDIIIDGIHPTSSGSRKLANLVWPVLQPLL